MNETIPPVHRSVTVKADAARAFDMFTLGMGRWWPPSHSIGNAPLVDVVVEPKVGGRWYSRTGDGVERDWGKVIAWEPPTRLVLAWQFDADWSFDPALVTEVEVSFRARSDGSTRVDLEHRHLERYGERAKEVRGMIGEPGGWQAILKSFASLADQAT